VTDVAGNFEYSTGISVTVANPTPTTGSRHPLGRGQRLGHFVPPRRHRLGQRDLRRLRIERGTINGEQWIATATPTYYGWLAEWNTTSVPDGTYKYKASLRSPGIFRAALARPSQSRWPTSPEVPVEAG